MIEFSDVKKVYNKKNEIISNVSFKVEKGEFVFLVGPSGAGKSTLLKMLYKAEKPTSGKIKLFDKDVGKFRRTKLRRNTGIVFQDFETSLLKNKTVFENVAYVLESQGKNPFKVKKMTLEALEKLGILEKKNNYPYELSGGEKQRVTIARAIVNKPEILICDEPTGNLDQENAEIVMGYLNQLNDEGATIVMTTHNFYILEKQNKRTLLVADGEVKEKEVDFSKSISTETNVSLSNLLMDRKNKTKAE
jgi:cell division transport system ATP-binding protein